MMDGQPQGTIPSNLRLLTVIEEIAKAGVPVTPTDINAVLGLPKPTIHRLFATLEAEGFLQRDIDGRTYSPGLRLRVLSTGVLSSVRIRTARLTILRQLSTRIGETCNIALPDRDAMVYLERVETEWPLRIQLAVGTRVPFYCTASGKMHLASLHAKHRKSVVHSVKLAPVTSNTITDSALLLDELQLIADRGYSTDREEFMDGMIAVAVPILDANLRLVSTLSFHAPTQRFSIEQAVDYVPLLQEASAQLSDLIYTPDEAVE